ncbi:MAG: IPT/TIG domain-containing protein [Flavobacteriaceae bacterium]|nr:IPT/TIG domain-containing protein [Flavobacteriaceae bacterium]
MKLKLLLLLLLLTACSSESEDNNTPQSNNLKIVQITPLQGEVGDEVTIQWSGMEESVYITKVFFNEIESEIANQTENQIVCLIPTGATTGKVKLRVNNEEDLSEVDFIVNDTELPFSITETLPSTLRPGYLMKIIGSGFGADDNNVSVNYRDSSNQILEAVVRNVSENEIEVAIPLNAVTGNMELVINNLSLVSPVSIANIVHKNIYSLWNGGICYFAFDNQNKLNAFQVSSDSQFLALQSFRPGSFAYDPSSNLFFSASRQSNTTLKNFIYNPTNDNWSGTATPPWNYNHEKGVVFNSNTNKKYTVEYNNFDDSLLSFSEFDNSGNVISSNLIPNYDGNTHSTMRYFFAPSINSYVAIDRASNVIKIDASTFQFTLEPLVTPYSITNYGSMNFYDEPNHRIFISGIDDIYEVNLTTNVVTPLGTNISVFHALDAVLNTSGGDLSGIFYYEPTNCILARVFHGAGFKLLRINLASLQYESSSDYRGGVNPTVFSSYLSSYSCAEQMIHID